MLPLRDNFCINHMNKESFIQSYLAEQIKDSDKAAKLFDEKIKYRPVFHENSTVPSGKPKRPDLGRRLAVSSAAQRKSTNLFTLPKSIKYQELLPLNSLWSQYIEDITRDLKGDENLMSCILKADLHGALLKVTRSSCPTYVGMNGIVVQELMNTFVLVTPQNLVKKIPKKGKMFEMEVRGRGVTLFGSQFCVRSYERSTRKWKDRPTIDL